MSIDGYSYTNKPSWWDIALIILEHAAINICSKETLLSLKALKYMHDWLYIV